MNTLFWKIKIIKSRIILHSFTKLINISKKHLKKMCCVSARRLSIHKTYNKFRISLLNNCKKNFQFHTESKFFCTTYKIFFT
jgi:hypothetical protein